MANAVSADGSIVVGQGGVLDPELGVLKHASIWDAGNGMGDLKSVFEIEHGLVLPGWRVHQSHRYSADGRTIVGFAIDPTGAGVGWVATVPEPTFGPLIAVLLLGLLRRSRTRR